MFSIQSLLVLFFVCVLVDSKTDKLVSASKQIEEYESFNVSDYPSFSVISSMPSDVPSLAPSAIVDDLPSLRPSTSYTTSSEEKTTAKPSTTTSPTIIIGTMITNEPTRYSNYRQRNLRGDRALVHDSSDEVYKLAQIAALASLPEDESDYDDYESTNLLSDLPSLSPTSWSSTLKSHPPSLSPTGSNIPSILPILT
jgi:hypothetical protein